MYFDKTIINKKNIFNIILLNKTIFYIINKIYNVFLFYILFYIIKLNLFSYLLKSNNKIYNLFNIHKKLNIFIN